MVTIASPCHEDWNGMSPRPEGRHCASCDQVVVDLTGLGTAQRRERLREISASVTAGRRVCVRGRVERDGALAGSRRVLTAGLAAILAMTVAGCQGEGPEVETRQDPSVQQPLIRGQVQGDVVYPPLPRMTMGEMCVPEPTLGAPAPLQGKVVGTELGRVVSPAGDG